jgi:hypothetical protein
MPSPLAALLRHPPETRRRILAGLTDAERAALDRERLARSFRAFAEDALGIAPSPLIAAIMDASDALPVTTIDDVAALRHFGCTRAALPRARPRTVVTRAGGRGGKSSRLLAPKALHAAVTVPAPLLARGEEAYAVVAAPTMRLARQTFTFCRGYVDGSADLRARLVGEPTTESLALRRDDGTVCRVEVFAAGRGGAQLRAKTLVFAGFDEACFFRDEATGVVNDAELYRAVLQRVVPDGQAWLASTPWLLGVGLIEDFIGRDWGTHVHALCVVAPTRALNPSWDPDGTIERDLRAQDPEAAEREIDAIPSAGGSSLFFAAEAIKAATNERRALRLPRDRAADYGAGGDCAFKRNSSALAVVETIGDDETSRLRLAHLDELRPEPGLPLKPSGVVDHFAAALADYGVAHLAVDAHERGEVETELNRHGMSAVDAPDKSESYIFARKLLHEGRLELPDHPRLLRQLRAVVAKPRPGGGITISSPRTADGAHGDLVSALVLAVWQAARHAGDAQTFRAGKRR